MRNKVLTLVGFMILSAWIAWLARPQAALASGVVGDGSPASCTEAALDAALSGGGVVTFNCGPNPHTIPITSEKLILVATYIDGGNLITLNGGGTTRLFSVNAVAALELHNITLTGGSASQGGGIYNAGVLSINNSSLTNNWTGGYGGAIYNTGVLIITRSFLSKNAAAASFAGGIYNAKTGSATLIDSSLTENFGGLSAGGLLNLGTATVRRVTFHKNRGAYGGGVLNFGALSVEESIFSENSTYLGWGGAMQNEANGHEVVITDSTFANNISENSMGGAIANFSPLILVNNLFYQNSASSFGGAIYNYDNGRITVTNNTFSENEATTGGGIHSTGIATITNSTFSKNTPGGLVQSGAGTIEALNTIVAGNSTYNCDGVITSAGYNLEDANTCGFSAASDRPNTDPLLGPLADNGGLTWTHSLLAGSPAINAGTNSGCPNTDQRGVRRPLLGTCDIGAYEFGEQLYLPLARKN